MSDPRLPSTRPAALAPGVRYPEPLSRAVKLGLLVLVVVFHVGGGWALTLFEPVRLVVGDIASIEVRMVEGEAPGAGETASTAPDLPPAEAPPLPDFTPPPELAQAVASPPPEPPPPVVPQPELALAVEPPAPDLPPPEFPVPPKPPEKLPEPQKKVEPPRPQKPPEPAKPPPRPAQKPAPAAPSQAAPSAAPPGQPAAGTPAAAPRTVSAAQLGYVVAPSPVYPARSRRMGEEGRVTVRALVDTAGRPTQVTLQASSGHGALDEAALSAVRAAQFRPPSEGGVPQAVWVLVPITFMLK